MPDMNDLQQAEEEMRELLPCPFCGGPGTRYDYEDHGNRFTNYCVLCGSDECPASELVVSSIESQEAADIAWNTRRGIADALRGAEPVYWEVRHFDSNTETWCDWERVEARNPVPVEGRLSDIKAYIARGYKYELRELYSSPQPQVAVEVTDEVERLRHIAHLIGAIFVYGDFKAETHNERELEKLLRENGTFWESHIDYEAALTQQPSTKECTRQYYDKGDEEWVDTACPNLWREQGSEVRALYAALPSARSEGWQPIETAPKDGSEIDVFCTSTMEGDNGGYRIANVWWSVVDARWRAYGDNLIAWAHQPTHWRPLPPPPPTVAGEG